MESRFVASLLSVMFVFSLAGCASKQAVPPFEARYYPQCYDPIEKLCKDQDNSQEIKEGIGGAVIGALGGAVIGAIATGDWKGAAVGAAAGAAAGGVTGFFHARLSKIEDRKERLAEYQKMLGENSQGWDLERASVEKSYQCYREQIALLQKAVKAKKISKEEFLARANEIKEGIEHINTYWADSQTRMDERLADGEAFLKHEEEENMKLAKAQQRQAQKDTQKLRKATASQKSKVQKEYALTNALKEKTETDFADALAQAREYLGVTEELACRDAGFRHV